MERSDCGNLNAGCDDEDRDRHVGWRPPRDHKKVFARDAAPSQSTPTSVIPDEASLRAGIQVFGLMY